MGEPGKLTKPSGSGGLEPDPEPGVVALDGGSLPAWADLGNEVRRHLVAGHQRIVIDVTGLGRLSSAAVAGLLSAKRSAGARGGQVVVSGCSSTSKDTLTRAGLLGGPDHTAPTERSDAARSGRAVSR